MHYPYWLNKVIQAASFCQSLFPFLADSWFRISERRERKRERKSMWQELEISSPNPTQMRDLQGCVSGRHTQILFIPWVNADFPIDDSRCGIFHGLDRLKTSASSDAEAKGRPPLIKKKTSSGLQNIATAGWINQSCNSVQCCQKTCKIAFQQQKYARFSASDRLGAFPWHFAELIV